LSKINKQVNSW